MKKTITAKITILAFVMCLAGCAQQTASTANPADDVSGTQSESVIGVQTVSESDLLDEPILIDRTGYAPEDIKTIFFKKGNRGDVFSVVNADSKETVYSGQIDHKDKGDFSAVVTNGRYYIEVAHVGRSHVFTIDKNRYSESSQDLHERVLAYANNSDMDFGNRVSAFLWLVRYAQAYEPIDSDRISADTSKSAKEFFDAADELKEAGAKEQGDLALSDYCVLMAMLYERFLEYDNQKANTYLTEAAAAYGKLSQGEDVSDDFVFQAAAELYKATGNVQYLDTVQSYLKDQTQRKFFAKNITQKRICEDEAYISGVLAYLSTTNKVDADLCEKHMDNLTHTAQEFAADVSADNYYCVGDDLRNALLADRLYVIAIVEHVIVSREYNNILKNGIHYISGCNESGGAFISQYGICDTAYDVDSIDAAVGGAYMYILGEIIDNEN